MTEEPLSANSSIVRRTFWLLQNGILFENFLWPKWNEKSVPKNVTNFTPMYKPNNVLNVVRCRQKRIGTTSEFATSLWCRTMWTSSQISAQSLAQSLAHNAQWTDRGTHKKVRTMIDWECRSSSFGRLWFAWFAWFSADHRDIPKKLEHTKTSKAFDWEVRNSNLELLS